LSLLILGAGPLQQQAYIRAKQRNIKTIGIDKDPHAIAFQHAHENYVIDICDTEGVLDVARARQVTAILTLCTDLAVLTAAQVAKQLNLPGLTTDTAKKSRHKGLMRDALNTAQVPIPNYRRTGDFAQAQKAADAIGLPVILKPTTSSGSRGVNVVCDMYELEHAFVFAQKYSEDQEVLVEQLIHGPEVSVETLSFNHDHHVIQITDKTTSLEPHFVELGHVQPTLLSTPEQSAVITVTKNALNALGCTYGASHTEIKLQEGTPYIMEVGARLGGDYITTDLVPLSTGVSMVDAVIDLALGKTPQLQSTKNQAAAICYIQAPPGTVQAVSGVFENFPYLMRAELFVQQGDSVRALQSSHHRAGYVICTGDTPSQAKRHAWQAAQSITIHVN